MKTLYVLSISLLLSCNLNAMWIFNSASQRSPAPTHETTFSELPDNVVAEIARHVPNCAVFNLCHVNRHCRALLLHTLGEKLQGPCNCNDDATCEIKHAQLIGETTQLLQILNAQLQARDLELYEKQETKSTMKSMSSKIVAGLAFFGEHYRSCCFAGREHCADAHIDKIAFNCTKLRAYVYRKGLYSDSLNACSNPCMKHLMLLEKAKQHCKGLDEVEQLLDWATHQGENDNAIMRANEIEVVTRLYQWLHPTDIFAASGNVIISSPLIKGCTKKVQEACQSTRSCISSLLTFSTPESITFNNLPHNIVAHIACFMRKHDVRNMRLVNKKCATAIPQQMAQGQCPCIICYLELDKETDAADYTEE